MRQPGHLRPCPTRSIPPATRAGMSRGSAIWRVLTLRFGTVAWQFGATSSHRRVVNGHPRSIAALRSASGGEHGVGRFHSYRVASRIVGPLEAGAKRRESFSIDWMAKSNRRTKCNYPRTACQLAAAEIFSRWRNSSRDTSSASAIATITSHSGTFAPCSIRLMVARASFARAANSDCVRLCSLRRRRRLLASRLPARILRRFVVVVLIIMPRILAVVFASKRAAGC